MAGYVAISRTARICSAPAVSGSSQGTTGMSAGASSGGRADGTMGGRHAAGRRPRARASRRSSRCLEYARGLGGMGRRYQRAPAVRLAVDRRPFGSIFRGRKCIGSLYQENIEQITSMVPAYPCPLAGELKSFELIHVLLPPHHIRSQRSVRLEECRPSVDRRIPGYFTQACAHRGRALCATHRARQVLLCPMMARRSLLGYTTSCQSHKSSRWSTSSCMLFFARATLSSQTCSAACFSSSERASSGLGALNAASRPRSRTCAAKVSSQ